MIEALKSVFISPRGTISSKRLTGFLMITLAGALITYATLNTIKEQKKEYENLNTINEQKKEYEKLDKEIRETIKQSIDLNDNLTGLIRDLIYGGVALVGSTIFEKKFKERKNETK